MALQFGARIILVLQAIAFSEHRGVVLFTRVQPSAVCSFIWRNLYVLWSPTMQRRRPPVAWKQPASSANWCFFFFCCASSARAAALAVAVPKCLMIYARGMRFYTYVLLNVGGFVLRRWPDRIYEVSTNLSHAVARVCGFEKVSEMNASFSTAGARCLRFRRYTNTVKRH